jgi:acyl CoA:acetate/3-ketoacid CoA transferase alpha subunit
MLVVLVVILVVAIAVSLLCAAAVPKGVSVQASSLDLIDAQTGLIVCQIRASGAGGPHLIVRTARGLDVMRIALPEPKGSPGKIEFADSSGTWR